MIVESYDNMLRRWQFNEDGSFSVTGVQDVTPLLKKTEEARCNEVRSEKVGEFMHYASIPCSIVEDLMFKGLNIFNQNDLPRIKKEIDSNYPYLKMTNRKGW